MGSGRSASSRLNARPQTGPIPTAQSKEAYTHNTPRMIRSTALTLATVTHQGRGEDRALAPLTHLAACRHPWSVAELFTREHTVDAHAACVLDAIVRVLALTTSRDTARLVAEVEVAESVTGLAVRTPHALKQTILREAHLHVALLHAREVITTLTALLLAAEVGSC